MIKNPILMIIATTIIFSVAFSSCKDDNPESKPGSLAFHLHTLVDTTEVENYGDLLTLSDGRQIIVTTAQLYISNVKLIKTDGSVVDGPSTVILMKQGIEEYEIGDVPAGNYKSVRFDVGLDNTTNASNPVVSDQILYQPSMWFGATAQPDGFVFVNFQGTIDTTSAGTGSNLIPFIYKIGTNANRVTVTMPDQNFTVIPDQLTVEHLEANYAKLFEGIQLNVSQNLNLLTALQNSDSWVSQVKDNIADMFEYEE